MTTKKIDKNKRSKTPHVIAIGSNAFDLNSIDLILKCTNYYQIRGNCYFAVHDIKPEDFRKENVAIELKKAGFICLGDSYLKKDLFVSVSANSSKTSSTLHYRESTDITTIRETSINCVISNEKLKEIFA